MLIVPDVAGHRELPAGAAAAATSESRQHLRVRHGGDHGGSGHSHRAGRGVRRPGHADQQCGGAARAAAVLGSTGARQHRQAGVRRGQAGAAAARVRQRHHSQAGAARRHSAAAGSATGTQTFAHPQVIFE